MTTRGRPPFGFVLISLPSDHEVDRRIPSECDVIRSILVNREHGSLVKEFQATSIANFNGAGWSPYQRIGFVHLAGHANTKGMGLIGGLKRWSEIAKKLKVVAPVLVSDKKRVLCLSCCHSKAGVKAMTKSLRDHFTGVYYFKKKKIGFAEATTIWSMFYLRKGLANPSDRIADDINEFLGEKLLVYTRL